MTLAQLMLLLLGINSLAKSSFVGKPHLSARRRSRQGSLKETLTFRADLSHISDPLLDAEVQKVTDFFRQAETRNYLLSAGGKRSVEEEPLTPTFKAMWEDVSEYFGSSSVPNEDDLLLTCTVEINFPGLTIVNKLLNGVKEVVSDKGMPEYEFYLVGEMQETRGAPAVVWLFNTLTGANRKPKGEFSRSKAYALTSASIVEKGGCAAFSFRSNIEINIEFPDVLIRILPASVEKMEKQGSDAVMKVLSREMAPAVIAVRDSFLKWQASPVCTP
jgi:hypothetical protein